jgi:hypothetical protein
MRLPALGCRKAEPHGRGPSSISRPWKDHRAERRHQYTMLMEWTERRGEGPSGYRTHERAHEISAPRKR